MKKEKKQVAKLEKTAKVDSKKMLITDAISESYMRDKIEKKKGRPKKPKNHFKDPIKNVDIKELKRVTKTMSKATLEDIEKYLENYIELSYPILEQVLGKEFFSVLIQKPNVREILSSENVKKVIAEMTKEFTDYTLELLDALTGFKIPLKDINQVSMESQQLKKFKEKYSEKLKKEIDSYYATHTSNEGFKRIVTEYLSDKEGKPIEEALEKQPEKLIDDLEDAVKSVTSPIGIGLLPTSKSISTDLIPQQAITDLAQVISLRLTNTTDEKLHNVKIFNFDFKEQNQIKYENLIGMSYSEFLRKWDKLESKKYNINKVRLVAICDYKKFERKQLGGKLFYKNTNVFSLSSSVPTEPMMWYSPFQEQPNIIDIERIFRILSDTEFELEYLMPDTAVEVHFFIIKNPEK
jgi:hypothetical protein